MGGKVDGRVSGSTDSGLRLGLSVHSVQLPVGPVSRSASDTTTRLAAMSILYRSMSMEVRTSRDRVDVGVTLPRCRYIDRCTTA